MKKSLVAALTTALVVGAASTTFAAVNPFTDVPADHWAYDAVTQLAADGVIEGYGDDTFRGQQEITRYEMAQMIAKAMAKTDVSASDRALIDRLAAEFADELNNLGVRVANLERNADMVKWNGKIEYTYTSTRYNGEKKNHDHELFRLEPSAEVNNHWHVNARLDAANDMDSDSGDDYEVTLKRVYAEGDYDNFNIKLGKQELYTNEGAGRVSGLVFDNEFSGAAVTFGNTLKTTLLAGRVDVSDSATATLAKEIWPGTKIKDDAANLQGINLQYAPSKLSLGAGYYHVNTDAFTQLGFLDGSDYAYGNDSQDDANIWSVNAGYAFDSSSKIVGAYAQNTEADEMDKSFQFEYDYKGAQKENKGSWGAWVGYRYLSPYVSLFGTQDDLAVGTKGWTVGADYTLMKNIVLTARYADGEDIVGGADYEKLFGRVEFFF